MTAVTLTAEVLSVQSPSGLVIELTADRDGDIEIYRHEDAATFYIRANDVPALRDWLNKVIPS